MARVWAGPRGMQANGDPNSHFGGSEDSSEATGNGFMGVVEPSATSCQKGPEGVINMG